MAPHRAIFALFHFFWMQTSFYKDKDKLKIEILQQARKISPILYLDL